MRSGDGERAERGTSGQWRLRVAALSCGAALILSACAGDSPESVEAALGDTAPNLAFVDDSEGTCVGEAIMRAVGFEQLAADGHTSETIRTTSPEAISAIVDGAGDDVRDGIIECLDVNGLVRTEVTALNGNDELACAETDFSVDTPFVDQYIQARFDDSNAELDIDDTDENRDLLRPCLSEASFAETFGLDTRDALEAAIEDALPTTVQSADGPCIGSLVVDHFGSAEATNAAGISVESPQISLDELDLEQAALSGFTRSAIECSNVRLTIFEEERSAEPSYHECLIDLLDNEFSFWMVQRVQDELGSDRASTDVQRQRESALGRCVQDRVLDAYGTTSVDDVVHARLVAEEARELLSMWVPQIDRFGFTEADMVCAAVNVVETVDLGRLLDLSLSSDPANPSDELIVLSSQYWWAFDEGYTKCSANALYDLSPAILRNFSAETIDCTVAELGSAEELAAQYEALAVDETIALADFIIEVEILERRLTDAVKGCHSAEETDLFEDWTAWLQDLSEQQNLNVGEPDSVST